MNFKEKTVLVTGASRGIGAEIANTFAKFVIFYIDDSHFHSERQ